MPMQYAAILKAENDNSYLNFFHIFLIFPLNIEAVLACTENLCLDQK